MTTLTGRRAEIADAAIGLIAGDGVRSLTHRALDRQLQLPAGSVSYYLRTRRELLAAIVQRLADRTVADVLEPGERALTAPVGSADAVRGQPADRLVDLLAGRMADLLTAAITTRPDDVRARFALAAELVGDPVLHEMITTGSPIRRRMLDDAEHLLTVLDVPAPGDRAPDLVAFCDSILHDRLLGARAHAAETPEEMCASIRLAIGDYLRGAAQALG